MNKKQIKQRRKYSWVMFWIFSAVLFINNTNQLISTWVDLFPSQINTISWIGIVGSLIYVLWLKE